MDIFSLLLQSILFLIGIIVCFYIPGKVVTAYLKFTLVSLEKYIFPIVIGFITFTFVSYLLDLFHIFFFIYPLLILSLVLFLKNRLWSFPLLHKIDGYALVFIIFSALVFSYPPIFSGVYANGVHLVNINASDGMFHTSLIQELQHHLPPDHPGFAGGGLTGYHIFADYVWAKFLQIFPVSIFFLFFQFEPVFIAFLWGSGVYLLLKRWTKSASAGFWGIFLSQFGGSFVFLFYLFGHTHLSLDSGLGMLQAAVSLINPPFATSTVIILFGLFSLFNYLETKEKKWIFPLILFFGLGAEFKVYAGILLIGGFLFLLGSIFLQRLIKTLQQKKFSFKKIVSLFPIQEIAIFVGIVFLFFITYMHLSGKGGFLIYYPYWAPIDIVRSNLSFMNYDNQMYVYGQLGMVHRIVWLHIRIFLMFLFGNLGSRALGWLFLYFYPKKKAFFFSEFTLIIFVMMLAAFFIPLLSIQSIKPFEITQMFNYFLFFASLFGAIGFMSLFRLPFPKFIKAILFILIILITIPSAIESYYGYHPTAIPTVSNKEYQALKFLKQQGSYTDTVLVLPLLTNLLLSNKQETWIHNTNMLYPALMNKRSFFTDENISYPDDIPQRVDFLTKIALLESSQPNDGNLEKAVIKGLHQNHIIYIYSKQKLPVVAAIKIQQLYATENAYIYKVL